MKTNRIITGEALEELKKLPDESIDCVMTSPPYWGLRDYGHDNQLGLEPDFREYIENLCLIFDEVKRVLKKTGTCWVNLGDTYFAKQSSNRNGVGGSLNSNPARDAAMKDVSAKRKALVPEKSLVQIPSRFAIAMTDRGWILRNEIVWYKKNVMPSSVKDRFTVDFEKIFFFTKNKKYYFEQQFDISSADSGWAKQRKRGINNYKAAEKVGNIRKGGKPVEELDNGKRNKRTVWQINPKPFSEAHFAVFPPKLVETPIKAGCPENGIVLDPFLGSGTTALVSEKLNRKWLGIELNSDYVKIAEKRLGQQGLGI